MEFIEKTEQVIIKRSQPQTYCELEDKNIVTGSLKQSLRVVTWNKQWRNKTNDRIDADKKKME